MTDIQRLVDRAEIQDLLVAYCHAIDSGDWDALDDIFTPDADIDYTEAGGIKGTYPDIKVWLGEALSKFSKCQHLIGMPMITIKGDRASARTALYNPMVMTLEEGTHTFFVGMWYVDDLVRTDKGWRITTRREEACYFHNMPEELTP